MSTLTKILIVLLTFGTIFVCSMVVTYVATTENYKQAYEKLRSENQGLKATVSGFKQQINDASATMRQLEAKKNEKIQTLQAIKNQLEVELANTERNRAELLERINSWAGVVKGLSQTNTNLEQSLKLAQDELNKTREEALKLRKNLDEITAALNVKMVQLEAMETERKRLLEHKVALEQQLTGFSGSTERTSFKYGQTGGAFGAVTRAKDTVTVAEKATGQIVLQGLLTEVDLKNSMATVSMGSADGIQEGMRLHVTRGDTFICDILITDVDTDAAVGILELVQHHPEVGDNAANNW